MQPVSKPITGFGFRLLELKMLWRAAQTAFAVYPRWRDAWRALSGQIRTHVRYRRITHMTKAWRIGGDVFVQTYFPSLDSEASKILTINELGLQLPVPNRRKGLNLLLLAITKKCSLQCAHCFEWDNLNHRENLSVEDVLQIIRRFQADGVASIELSGGEPLNRYEDLLRILRESDTRQSDFWLITSGYRLTSQRALDLKSAGLIGVSISLDHWDPDRHDAFRGLKGSFDWAMQAARNAREAGLVLCFSLTAMRDFCNQADLLRFAELAHKVGAYFIRILEPKAVGHFAGKNVALGEKEIAALEDFTRMLQTQTAYQSYPIVDYYTAYQRHVGCSGAGRRFMYVDTDGDMHACPFCQNKCGNVLCDGIDSGRDRLSQASGCHEFVMS